MTRRAAGTLSEFARRSRFAVLVASGLLLSSTGIAQPLRLTFIGNESFRITDRVHTLYSDFPYESGYSIYNEYDPLQVVADSSAASIITHRHRDHFEPALARKAAWQIHESERATLWETVEVTPTATPHADIQHNSWLVEWGDARLYFVGDTEDTTALLAQRDLDVAFVTPWLLRAAERHGRIDAEHVVVYHHTATESVECIDCIVPKQLDQFVLREDGTLTLVSD